MPSTKDIKRRIVSVKSTKQITKAMKMVSAVKLRKAQMNVVQSRPYAQRMLSVIANIAAAQSVKHPLLETNVEPKKILLVVLTSDRGLCGSFNASIQKFAERYYFENKSKVEKIDFFFIGRKAADYMKKHKVNNTHVLLNLSREISYNLAATTANTLLEKFLDGQYDEIRLIYNEFKSAISQNVVCETLLPIDTSKATLNESSGNAEYIFEPRAAIIVEQLLKKHFAVHVYRCMSESIAAEHGARMTAMENATKNADEMIRKMTIAYNKARQAGITKELIEICSGAEALKG